MTWRRNTFSMRPSSTSRASVMRSRVTSTRSAGQSDEIGDTIDYAQVVERLRSELGQRHFLLLERLAEYVASLLLDEFGAIWVRVSVAKLGVLRDVRRVGVTIERGNAPV